MALADSTARKQAEEPAAMKKGRVGLLS